MAIRISRSAGNILRSDIAGQSDVRSAARLLASLLHRDLGHIDTFVLDAETDDETGEPTDLSLYTYDDFVDILDEADAEDEN